MNRHIILFIILLLFISCKNHIRSVYYKLVPATFSDDLTLEGTVEAVNSSTIICPGQIDGTIISLVENGTKVKKGDTVVILENRELANEYEKLLTNVEKSKAQYEKSKADLQMDYAVLRAQVESNEAQTAISNLDSAQLSYLSPQQRKIKELELKKAAIEKTKYEKKLSFLEKINESELKKVKLEIEQNQNKAERIKGLLDQMILTSPQDGIALRAKSWLSGSELQDGDEAWGSMPLVRIPDKTKMKVVLQAPEAAYKRVKENDKVIYTFDAMPGNMAWGKILKKAPMGKPVSRNSKVKYFEITASVDSFNVIPDMGISANCKIILAQIPDTIIVPQLAIFTEDSMDVVYVKHKHHFEKREVLLGESSPREAVVAAGLTGNETVTFEKPALAKIKATVLLPDSLKQKQDAPEKPATEAGKSPSISIHINQTN